MWVILAGRVASFAGVCLAGQEQAEPGAITEFEAGADEAHARWKSHTFGRTRL